MTEIEIIEKQYQALHAWSEEVRWRSTDIEILTSLDWLPMLMVAKADMQTIKDEIYEIKVLRDALQRDIERIRRSSKF
ncbi:hypothetical protein HYW32_02885 [Candidatus Berkelbacteria bacterium]|nr:hypothetical protein [Candidatus Berkelbacteria bacterium]